MSDSVQVSNTLSVTIAQDRLGILTMSGQGLKAAAPKRQVAQGLVQPKLCSPLIIITTGQITTRLWEGFKSILKKNQHATIQAIYVKIASSFAKAFIPAQAPGLFKLCAQDVRSLASLEPCQTWPLENSRRTHHSCCHNVHVSLLLSITSMKMSMPLKMPMPRPRKTYLTFAMLSIDENPWVLPL